ncbi:MAG: UbiH/UbiF/VisC/COQ6 family ubiquinone biosynthesis hydroxylase [Rickettsiales bacterium]
MIPAMRDIEADILIIGAGLVGAAQALALSKEGIRSVIVERDTPENVLALEYDGRVSAISHASVQVMKHIGIWETLLPHAGPMNDIRVVDEDSPALVHFSHTEVGSEPFGYMLPNVFLRQTLLRAVMNNSNITYLPQTELESTTAADNHRISTLKDGRTIRSSLLLAADGKFSQTREMLAVGHRITEYGQTAIVATVKHSQPHHGIAVEQFLPAGPLALLPMTEDRTAVVWTEPHAMAKHIMQLPEEAFIEELEARLKGYLGSCIIQGKRHAYPLALIQADKYYVERAALIGDSAHGIHPIAGQGVNLGYRDVAVMTDIIANQKKLGLDLGSLTALEHYQQWRKFDAWSMAAVTDGLNRLFSTNRPLTRLVRRLGLSTFQRFSPLKQMFMQTAMGMQGDLPRMLQPESKAA